MCQYAHVSQAHDKRDKQRTLEGGIVFNHKTNATQASNASTHKDTHTHIHTHTPILNTSEYQQDNASLLYSYATPMQRKLQMLPHTRTPTPTSTPTPPSLIPVSMSRTMSAFFTDSAQLC